MGIRAHSIGEAANFMCLIREDPTAEELPTTSEWELFRYRREEVDDQGRSCGVHDYGIIYRNKKGRLTYTGAAEEDYRVWKDNV